MAGSINYDIVLALPEQPQAHTKVRALSTAEALGGAAANTAAWLAALGDDVSLIGRVGSDAHGSFCLDELQRLGVDCEGVTRDQRAPTSIGICWSAGEDKRIVTYSAYESPDSFDSLRFDPAQNPVLHVAASETDSLVAALSRARDVGVRASLELDGRAMARAREFASLAFTNYKELRAVFGIEWSAMQPEDVRTLLPTPGAALVVTVGAHCVRYVDHAEAITVPVSPIEIVDRTGGGDAFDAGFLHAWATGSDPATCVETGLATATQALARLGATP